MPPTTNASTGANRPGIEDLVDEPVALDGAGPAAAIAAPTTPPISACDELDGSPYHHVTRFQAIAPIERRRRSRSA